MGKDKLKDARVTRIVGRFMLGLGAAGILYGILMDSKTPLMVVMFSNAALGTVFLAAANRLRKEAEAESDADRPTS